MPKKKKDENEIAFEGLQELLRRDAKRDGLPVEPCSEPEKLTYRVEAGRKGAQSRKKKLSAKQRSEIARKAAQTRWSKK
jgi:hypothetical protein